jgi:hypothetical protein
MPQSCAWPERNSSGRLIVAPGVEPGVGPGVVEELASVTLDRG